MTDRTRRRYMGAVAALARTRWEESGYNIDNVENWEPMAGEIYTTGTVTPMELVSSGNGKVASWLIEDADTSERTLEVCYDSTAVYLSLEGRDDEIRTDGLAGFSPEQARTLGAALYQAGEELAARREGEEIGDE